MFASLHLRDGRPIVTRLSPLSSKLPQITLRPRDNESVYNT